MAGCEGLAPLPLNVGSSGRCLPVSLPACAQVARRAEKRPATSKHLWVNTG